MVTMQREILQGEINLEVCNHRDLNRWSQGLYNIALKSLGAAMKRNPDVPLGHVIDYSELMNEPGYYFMNRFEGFLGVKKLMCEKPWK